MENTLRFHVSKDGHNAYQLWCGADTIFPQMSDMFFWCAVLGYKSGQKRRPLNKTKDVFQWNAFNEVQQIALTTIAIEDHGDFSIISPKKDSSTKDTTSDYWDFRDILEEYAEIGLTLLLNIVSENKKTFDDNYQALLNELIKKSDLAIQS